MCAVTGNVWGLVWWCLSFTGFHTTTCVMCYSGISLEGKHWKTNPTETGIALEGKYWETEKVNIE